MKQKIILISIINNLGGAEVKKQTWGERDKTWVQAQAALSLQGAKPTKVCAFFKAILVNFTVVTKWKLNQKKKRSSSLEMEKQKHAAIGFPICLRN